jgi:hypothetical protein
MQSSNHVKRRLDDELVIDTTAATNDRVIPKGKDAWCRDTSLRVLHTSFCFNSVFSALWQSDNSPITNYRESCQNHRMTIVSWHQIQNL